MQSRNLGKSDIHLSELGYGCWPIGGGWGQADDERDITALRNAFEHGVTFYDTAAGYGNGHSEEVVGQAFATCRDQVVIASKVPPKADPKLPADEVYPADWVIEQTEASLRRLNTDYLDLQQIHCWRDHFTDAPGWLEAMHQLQAQGKVRALGVSAEDWEWDGACRIVESGHIDAVQLIYNIFDQQPQERLLPTAQANQVGVLVRVPLFEGLLAGKLRPGHTFAEGDWRARFLTEERLREATPRLDALEELLDEDTPTLAALGLKFCLAHAAVSTVLAGMSNPRHVTANCAVSDSQPLSTEQLKNLAAHAWDHGWTYPWNQ